MAASSRRVDAASRERSEAPPKPESRRGEGGERRGSWLGGKRRAAGRRRAGRRANGRRGAAARVTIARRARTESTAVPVSLAVLHELVGEVAIRSEVRRGGRHGRPASVTSRLVPPALLGTLEPGTASEPGNGRAPRRSRLDARSPRVVSDRALSSVATGARRRRMEARPGAWLEPESFFRQPGCFSRRDFIGHLRTRTSRRRHGDRTVRSPRTLSARREGPALNGAHIAVSEAHLEPLRAECDPSTPHTRRASLARGPLRLGKSSLCRRQTATAQNRPRLQEARARWQTTTPTPSRPG